MAAHSIEWVHKNSNKPILQIMHLQDEVVGYHNLSTLYIMHLISQIVKLSLHLPTLVCAFPDL